MEVCPDLLHFVKKIIHNSDKSDRLIIDEVISATLNTGTPEAIFILIECSLYFDNIGDAARGLAVARMGLDEATRLEDQKLLRKACNVVAVAHARVCDYRQACVFLERALKLAAAQGEKIYEFAILCNIVSILQQMGLFEDAKRVALAAADFPNGSQALQYLHLQNAINGSQLASYTDDLKSAERFSRIARSTLDAAGVIGRPWKAYVEANEALKYVKEGLFSKANDIIQNAVLTCDEEANFRTKAILRCAQAQYFIATDNRQEIEESRKLLEGLLPLAESFPGHYEEILRTLVDLYSNDKALRAKKSGLRFLRLLNDYLINVKHRQFFARLSQSTNSIALDYPQLCEPFYDIPAVLVGESSSRNSPTRKLVVASEERAQAKALSFVGAARRKLEQSLRSPSFDIAEDWAVAADFAEDRLGHHCLEVGRLAGTIAGCLGLTERQSVTIEMACRLHDIGKLVINDVVLKAVSTGRVENYFVVREHTTAGGKLLSSMEGPVFKLASMIARHHHEWWNGCGYPDALKDHEIPLGARICLIADSYITLIRPSKGRAPWQSPLAANQVVAMADAQLDPNLMPAFLSAIRLYDDAERNTDGFPRISLPSRLGSAKEELLNSIGSVKLG